MRGHRLAGFEPRAERARGLRGLRDAARVTFGRKAPPPVLGEQTLWIPGHAFGFRSLRPAMRYFLRDHRNGERVAIFDARDSRFHADRPDGRVLSDAEVRATKLIALQFTRPRAGTAVKSPEIAAALAALGRTRPTADRLPLKIVTHSNGDTQLRTALLDHVDPAAIGVRIVDHVAVAPVYAGTWAGDLGAQPWFGTPIGIVDASRELAEHSPLHDRLDRSRDVIDAKLEGPRTDLAVEGAPSLRVDASRAAVRRTLRRFGSWLGIALASQEPEVDLGPAVATGDGLNQSIRLGRAGVATVILRGLDPTMFNHIFHLRYGGVIQAIGQALTAPASLDAR